MDMQQIGNTLSKDVVMTWHGQLMPVRTSLEMMISTESHSSEGSELRATMEFIHARIKSVLDEMDRASLTADAVEASSQAKQLHQKKDQADAMSFSADGGDLYQINPKASLDNILSQLSARLSQLNSMLIQTVGNGADTFHNWSDDIKDDYLWACQMHAHECKDLALHLELAPEKGRE